MAFPKHALLIGQAGAVRLAPRTGVRHSDVMSEQPNNAPWTLHWLNARGAVTPYIAAVDAAVADVRRRAAPVVTLPSLDLVVSAVPGRGIRETGHVGHSFYPGAIFLTLDPDNPRLADNLGEPLARMIAHELNHALRWETVGYGATLGEALVSEGLAGQFVAQLFASPPEPWEQALEGTELGTVVRAAQEELHAPRYDHNAWFFGAGRHPRWAGYRLGYALVGEWLAAKPDRTASGAISVPASEILSGLDILSGDDQPD